MISNQAPEGRAPAVPLDGGALSRAGGSIGSRLGGMNVSLLREVALLPVLVLLIVVGSVVSPAFFTVSNFAGIGEQSSALGVVVVGESLILLIGGMDLSLESTFGLAPMIAAWLIVPVAAYGGGHRPQSLPRHPRPARGRRGRRPDQRPADREGQAERVHRDPRHDDRARRPAERRRQGPVAVQPAVRVRLPRLGVLRPAAGLADRRGGHLRRRPGCSCATTGPAAPSTRSAATRRPPGRPASRSSGSRSASTSPAACSPRSAG